MSMGHKHLSGRAKLEIIQEYREMNPDGTKRYIVRDIAKMHGVSLGTVNNLVRRGTCPARRRGGQIVKVPSARTLKILRDATEPGMTLQKVGERNPRYVTENGKKVAKPLTRQRIMQIVKTWSKRRVTYDLHGRGFKPGDVIEWDGGLYTVTRYDDRHKGAVRDNVDGLVIDPFFWTRGAPAAKRASAVSTV